MKGRLTKMVRHEILARTYTWAIVWVLGMLQLPAQSLIDPVSGSLTSFTPINSDYGPRNVTSGTNPHIGIDYHLPQGGKAYAVEGGTIQNIKLTGSNPYIRINNWRYFHMYVGQTPDLLWEAVVAEVDPIQKVLIPVIFQRQIQNGNLSTVLALAASNAGWLAEDPLTKTKIAITNQVNAGDWVFVSDGGNHLHIDYSPTGKDGWENPLKFIRHLDQVAPTSTLHLQRIIYNNALTIYDSVVYGHPLILCSENNVSVEKDLEKAEIFTTPEGRPKELIRKWEYSHHKLQGIPIRVKNSLAIIQSAPDSGIYPAPVVVSIDYLKHYWYSRAKADGGPALCVLEARHPDGYHVLEHVTADITNHSSTQTRKVILDNFKPFIKTVSISTDKLLYAATAYWDGNVQQLGWSVQSAGHFATGFSDAQLHVQTSEPMKFLTVNMPGQSVLPWGYMQPQNALGTEWTATIPQLVLYVAIMNGASGFQPLVFNGADRAGNTLFVPNFPGTTPSYLIPRRHNDGSWTVPGSKAQDDNHGFYLKEGPSGNILDAEFVASTTMGVSPLTVDFLDASSGNPVQYHWTFGNGAVSALKYPSAITYVNNTSHPVTYSVSLKVKDALLNEDTEFKVNHITVLPAGSSLHPEASFTFVQSNLGAPSTVSFVNQSKGNQLTYYWDFDDGSTSTSFAPTHVFYSPGYFDVRLTVVDKDGNTDIMERPVFVYTAMTGTVNVFFTVNDPAKAGEFTKFSDKTTGVPLFARKLWDFGDGNLVEVLGTPTYLYYSPGVYQVRLEVRDYLDNTIGVYCRMVDVIPNALKDLTTLKNQVKAPDGAWGDAFGHSVAINGDWLFVGAPYDDDKGNQSGSAYVFRLQADSSYVFFQKLLPAAGSPYDYFGHALSSDGTWLVVGGYKNANYGHGRVWFFEYDGTKWQERQVFPCPVSNRYFFGWSVSLKGNRAIVGAKGGPNKTAGMAVIYRHAPMGWVQEATLSANATGIDHFGEKVAIDGDHVMVSYKPSNGDKVRFYRYLGQAWQLLSEKGVIDVESIALECPLAVIGDIWNNQALIYRYNGNTWLYETSIAPEDGADPKDDFGEDVAIAGSYIFVGAAGDMTLSKTTGSAYLFRRDYYGNWQQHLKLIPQNGDAKDRFGHAVALSHSHAVIGSYGWKSSLGSAYTYPYVTDPCDRKIKVCHDQVHGGETRLGESGTLEMGGNGCDLVFEPGSEGYYLSRNSLLQDGFTALEGSEVTITAVNCYYSGAKAGQACSCTDGLLGTHPKPMDSHEELHIYPNPAKDQAVVAWKAGGEQAILRVINMDGQLVWQQESAGETEVLQLSSWAPGVYLVEVQIGNFMLRSRLVKVF